MKVRSENIIISPLSKDYKEVFIDRFVRRINIHITATN